MKKSLRRILDILGIPLTLITIGWSKVITISDENNMPATYRILRRFGILPVRDHYYEPLINPQKHLKNPLDRDRYLPGIDMNIEYQLELLKQFKFGDELNVLPRQHTKKREYHFNNGRFDSGDSEFLYNMIRHFKPARMIEIGSGMSTLMAQHAFQKNKKENNGYDYIHTCIEPYEVPWLESTGVEVIRKKAEDLPLDLFRNLQTNDILFIDSSHIIRPQGDVLTEFLEILPGLNPGVIVHIHDIFTPKDYPADWIFTKHRLWNEQYLLEAFLSNNSKYSVMGALNFLRNHYPNELYAACPVIGTQPNRQPGSFWIRANH
jgi:predicted O-methyltransferase YrrM